MHFDLEFTEQVVKRGRIEDIAVLRGFFRRTAQPLMQDWLVAIARSIAMRLPVKWGAKMAVAQVFKPRTRGWSRAKAALEAYIRNKEAEHRALLGRERASKEESDHAAHGH
jgi:heterodisulfide reductase subunit C